MPVNASSYPAPSAATIAAAVAAPSAATIATAVAAAVPTTAGITTIVQSNSSAYNGTWTDLGTTNFSGATSTTTITGLGGYKQLKMYVWISPTTSSQTFMRFNGDTASNYVYNVQSYSNSGRNWPGSSMSMKPAADGNDVFGLLTVSPANSTTTKKIVISENYAASGGTGQFNGMWLGTAAITSVTFIVSAGTFSSGYAQIWGIN